MTEVKGTRVEELDKLMKVLSQFSAEDRKRAIDASSIFLEGGLAMLRITHQNIVNTMP